MKRTLFLSFIFSIILITSICQADISGRVIDTHTSAPLSLVKVQLRPANIITLTDNEGYFSFAADKGNKLIISRIGYKEKSVEINAGETFLVIKLEPSDIKIAGISIRGDKSNSIAEKQNNVEVIDVKKNVSIGLLHKLETNSSLFIRENSMGEKLLSLNGCSQKQIAILVDGVKVNTSSGQQSAIQIPASFIDRVEVSRGSNSALAGSSALGGVVNFILNEPDTTQSKHNFTVTTGSWQKYSVNYNGTFEMNDLKILMSLNSQTAKNNFSYFNKIENSEKKRMNNEYTSSSFQLKLNNPLAKSINQKLSFYLQSTKKGIPGQTTDYMYYKKATACSELSRIHSKTTFDFPSSLLYLDILYKEQTSHYENTESDVFHKYDSHNNTKIITSNLSLNYTKNIFSSAASINFRYESYKFDNLLENGLEQSIPLKIRRTLSFINHNELELNPHSALYKINSGFRYDRIFDEANALSYNLGLEIIPEFWHNLSLSFNAGNSYRLPEFTSLFWKGDSRVQGNPDLDPELAHSVESTLQWNNDLHTISISGFINKIDNLIYWHRTALGIWTPKNLATAKISGLRSKIQTSPWEFLSLSSSFTRLNPINKTTDSDHYGNYLIYKSLHKWITEIQFHLKKLNFYFRNKNIGRQFTNFDNLVKLNGYNICDLGFSYEIDASKNIYLDTKFQITNVFSESYENYRYIPAAGRGYSFKVELNIK